MDYENGNLEKCSANLHNPIKLLNSNFDEAWKNNTYFIINPYKYQINLIELECDEIFNQTIKHWWQLECTILSNSTTTLDVAVGYRKQIIQILYLCVLNLKNNININVDVFLKKFQLLKYNMFQISELNEENFAKLSTTSVRDGNTQVYHYFHCYMDMHWYLLVACHLGKASDEYIKKFIEEIMKDLVIISKKLFATLDNKSELEVEPFMCICVKKMWLRLQLFTEKVYSEKVFWEYLNPLLTNNDSLFTFWMIYHLTILYGFDDQGINIGKRSKRVQENHIGVETTLKILLNSNVDDKKLFRCLKLIQPLLNEWWIEIPKLESYQIFWEYFNKSLNITNNKPPTTAMEIIEDSLKYHSRPYTFFLHMLSNHLKFHPQQWAKMKGRIYSRLPLHKINELNDNGLYNVTLLFVSLRHNNFEEIISKLQSICDGLSQARQNTEFIFNIYIALIILVIQENKDIEKISSSLVKLLNNCSKDRNQFHLITLFIKGFEHILSISNNFRLNQKKLLGEWVINYMQHCSYNNLCYFLNVLLLLFEKVRNVSEWCVWDHVFHTYVYPSLKLVSNTTNAPSQIGKLAAVISLESPQMCDEIISFFISEKVQPKVSSMYICNILQNYPKSCVLTVNQMNSIIQAWVRCCIVTNENHVELTRHILKLSVFNVPDEWFNDDPICNFIEKLSQCSNTGYFRELCDICFGNIDNMISSYICNPVSGVTLRIYTCCACLIYYCAPFLYQKTNSCLLSRLITLLLLPPEFLIGRQHHPYIKSAIQRTLHLYIKGICKLNWKGNAFLNRTLRNLVVRYVPHFYDCNSPLLKCFDDLPVADVVLDKINTDFLSDDSCLSNELMTEENSNKALNFIYSYLQIATSTNNITFVIQKVMNGVLEFIILHSQRQNAIEIIRFLAASEFYVSVRNIVRQSIVYVTGKHMAFKTNSYFQFISLLIKLVPLDVQAVLPNIKEQVIAVEKMRGVGFDNVLRQGLSRIETALVCE